MLRYRLISLASILILLFSGAALYATRSSRQFQLRGSLDSLQINAHCLLGRRRWPLRWLRPASSVRG